MKLSSRLLIAFVLTLFVQNASAQDKEDMFNPVNASVTSQTIAPDARAAGMGDVGAATDPDVNSQYWNPAKYPFTISRAGKRYRPRLSGRILPHRQLQRRVWLAALFLAG